MVPSKGEQLAAVLCKNLNLNEWAVASDQKMVLKEGVQSDTDLSTMNQFTCFAISNPNGSQPNDKVYTDTDCDCKL